MIRRLSKKNGNPARAKIKQALVGDLCYSTRIKLVSSERNIGAFTLHDSNFPVEHLKMEMEIPILSGESKVHIEVLSVLWRNRLPILDGSLPLSRRAQSRITNCDVVTRKGPITLKVYRVDGTDEVLPNFKANDLHLGEWRKVVKACPNRTGKGWTTIYKQIQARKDYMHKIEHESTKKFKSSIQYEDHPAGTMLNDPILGTNNQEKDEKQSQNDKTGHGMEKTVKDKAKSKPKSQSSQKVNRKVNWSKSKKGPITLKLYRVDGTDEVLPNFKANDLHLGEWRKVVKACPNRTGKGWTTIYEQIQARMDYMHKTEHELHQGPGLDDHARAFSSFLLAEVDKRNLNPLKQMRAIEQLRSRWKGRVEGEVRREMRDRERAERERRRDRERKKEEKERREESSERERKQRQRERDRARRARVAKRESMKKREKEKGRERWGVRRRERGERRA
ncbi:hypothetical protein Tco_0002645 [Tanacetum coccineum]